MSQQIEFLQKAIDSSIDEAVLEFPAAITAGEAEALKGLSTEDIQKLLDVRVAMENVPGINAHFGGGSGTLNF